MVDKSNLKKIILISALIFAVFFLVIPLLFFSAEAQGNVAVINVAGVITGSGGSSPFGESVASSQEIVSYIEDASNDQMIEAIVIEINSPGGSAVASDEIADAIKKANKPTVAIIREAGASGGYWIASAAEHVIANRMSITGSIGVISSYLEFSGLMEDYGVSYERLVAGDNKDLGSPFKALNQNEKAIFQKKLDLIHDYFIQAVAENRELSEAEVRKIATGEFYLGVEALKLDLIDQLGSSNELETHLKEVIGLEEVTYAYYYKETGLLDVLGSLAEHFSFAIGEGIASFMTQETKQSPSILI